MKRILFISPQPFFQWRGSPIRGQFVLQAFSELGYQVDLLTLPFGEDVSLPNVQIIRVPNLFGVKNVAIGPSPVKALFDLVILYKAIGLLRKNNYDVIHGIEEGGFLALMLSRLFKTRAVFEKHSDPSSHNKGRLSRMVLSAYAKLEAFTVRRVNLVIGTGDGLAEQARKMQPGGEVVAIFDIPSSLVEPDAQRSRDIADKLRQQPDEILACFVGSFAVYQGIDLLFASIPYALSNNPQLRFMIIGGNDDEIAQQRAELAARSLDGRVDFIGKVPPDTLPDYLHAADILLVPRHSGVNTPLKVLDYFKAGRAIVATDVPSNRLILNDDTALFAAADAQHYGDAITQLAQDPARRQQLADNGHQLYLDKYNFHTFKGLLSDAYATLKLN